MRTLSKLAVPLLSISIAFVIACDDANMMDPGDDLGTLDPSSFLAIGNSLSAGFISGALVASGQETAFPNLLNTQFNAAGDLSNPFPQPLVTYPGKSGTDGVGVLELVGFDDSGRPIIAPALGSGLPPTGDAATFRNLGVPGATTFDVLNASGAATSASGTNGFFDLIVQGQTQFQRAKALDPTLIALWIGSNDVLGYAVSGGVSPSAPTPSATFTALYSQMADSLETLGADVIVANVPHVSAVPFFTTMGPWMAMDAALPDIYYVHGSGTIEVFDVARDFLLLTAPVDSFGSPDANSRPYALHPSNPLESEYVLDAAEAATASAAVSAFNQTIASIASEKGWSLVDINAFLEEARSGMVEQGTDFSTAFISGLMFSLDGVHPTSKGSGLIANEFISVINRDFGAGIAEVSLDALAANEIVGTPRMARGALDAMLETFGREPGEGR